MFCLKFQFQFFFQMFVAKKRSKKSATARRLPATRHVPASRASVARRRLLMATRSVALTIRIIIHITTTHIIIAISISISIIITITNTNITRNKQLYKSSSSSTTIRADVPTVAAAEKIASRVKACSIWTHHPRSRIIASVNQKVLLKIKKSNSCYG